MRTLKNIWRFLPGEDQKIQLTVYLLKGFDFSNQLLGYYIDGKHSGGTQLL